MDTECFITRPWSRSTTYPILITTPYNLHTNNSLSITYTLIRPLQEIIEQERKEGVMKAEQQAAAGVTVTSGSSWANKIGGSSVSTGSTGSSAQSSPRPQAPAPAPARKPEAAPQQQKQQQETSGSGNISPRSNSKTGRKANAENFGTKGMSKEFSDW